MTNRVHLKVAQSGWVAGKLMQRQCVDPMKFRSLQSNAKSCDILVWDTEGIAGLTPSFDNYSYRSLPVRQAYYFSARHIIYSLYIVLKKLPRFVRLLNIKAAFAANAGSRLHFKYSYVKKIILSVIDLSCLLSINPRLLITLIDDNDRYHALDLLIHDRIPVLTVQNGNRSRDATLLSKIGYEHAPGAPSFHSCFCALGKVDIDDSTKNRCEILESHVVGSVHHDFEQLDTKLKELYFETGNPQKDIVVVATGRNDRNSETCMASLLRGYVACRSVSIVVAMKVSRESKHFQENYDTLCRLYGDFATLEPRVGSSSLLLALSAKVVMGTTSTLLREAFAFGKKIYPISCGGPDLSVYFEQLKINHCPAQEEFNLYLESLLQESQESYTKRNAGCIDYIGVVPQDVRPKDRLASIIRRKLEVTAAR